MKIKLIKEVCGGSISAISDGTIKLSLVKKILGKKYMFENFGVLKYKIGSKEITFFEYGEILLSGFNKKEAMDFLSKFEKKYNVLSK